MSNYDLGLHDFSIEETGRSFILASLDPGRKYVCTAAVGLDINQHQIRRCLTKEYYHLTGSVVYSIGLQKKEKSLENIAVIESCKTANNDTFRTYASYMVALLSFYGLHTVKDRFKL